MSNATIKYYPVDNGDCTLITLGDGTTMLVDCNIRETAAGDTDDTKFDVKQDLLASLKRNASDNLFVDVFVLTHGDHDHCRGFGKNFYQGDPAKYTAEDRKAGRILIDELWFSPMVEEESSNSDEDVFEIEAMRRVALHRAQAANCNAPGNRVIVVGYDKESSFADLNHIRQTPGNIILDFNQKPQTTFSVFLHAPFKEHLYEKDRNCASIVFQARFKQNVTDADFSCLAMFGGDSDHYTWDIILNKTQYFQNDILQQALAWDLFLAPHHCSWSYFNDRPQADNPTPKPEPLAVLD
ncbi:MAG: MBL fold metallo-hydrolase, partial [Hymenobacter sp.]